MAVSTLFKSSIILQLVMEVIPQYPPFPSPYGNFPGMPAPMVPMGTNNFPMMNLPLPLQNMRTQQKLPVVVMPYRSKATDRKFARRKKSIKKYRESSESCSSESFSSSSEHIRYRKIQKNYLRKKKRPVLTPVISYVTNNGDIVYQKKIKKEKAEDWLHLNKEIGRFRDDSEESKSDEMTVRDLKRKYDLKWKRSKHKH
ncbi:unnamed protein product [Leptidea sinapis]|uniref:Uncharacterized protein n=1 Tax=Leptidea sinapis TaxID=189913 RepID=A0A5E4QNM4_9NEOP|nr:unnamed protein product [Leptidea sinapis]